MNDSHLPFIVISVIWGTYNINQCQLDTTKVSFTYTVKEIILLYNLKHLKCIGPRENTLILRATCICERYRSSNGMKCFGKRHPQFKMIKIVCA